MRAAGTLLAMLLATAPALADTYDDAACGSIAEYAMDIAYDQGLPMRLTPGGQSASTPEGCLLTQVLIQPNGSTGVMVDRIIFGGEGLADWAAGRGWPSKLSVVVENAHIWPSMPQFPEMEWVSRITSRRSAVNGAIELGWDAASGILSLDLVEGGAGRNWLRLSGFVSGIHEAPLLQSIPTLKLHDIDADLSFAGMFETIVLSPLALGLLRGQDDPDAAFQTFIAQIESYLVALPSPQVEADTVLNLGAFLDALPSPTGRLQLSLKAEDGIPLISAVPLLARMGPPTPEGLATVVKDLLGPARLRAQWTPGPGE